MKAVIFYGWKDWDSLADSRTFREWWLDNDLCRFVESNRWSYYTGRYVDGWGVFLTLSEDDYYLLKLKLSKPARLTVLEQ
jgi:hypothetical protein